MTVVATAVIRYRKVIIVIVPSIFGFQKQSSNGDGV
jgi:hypothetical protein